MPEMPTENAGQAPGQRRIADRTGVIREPHKPACGQYGRRTLAGRRMGCPMEEPVPAGLVVACEIDVDIDARRDRRDDRYVSCTFVHRARDAGTCTGDVRGVVEKRRLRN